MPPRPGKSCYEKVLGKGERRTVRAETRRAALQPARHTLQLCSGAPEEEVEAVVRLSA